MRVCVCMPLYVFTCLHLSIINVYLRVGVFVYLFYILFQYKQYIHACLGVLHRYPIPFRLTYLNITNPKREAWFGSVSLAVCVDLVILLSSSSYILLCLASAAVLYSVVFFTNTGEAPLPEVACCPGGK